MQSGIGGSRQATLHRVGKTPTELSEAVQAGANYETAPGPRDS